MKYLIPAVIYILIFLGVGYVLMKFFSSLTGVSLQKAVIWGFKTKKFQFVIPALLFYLLACGTSLSIISSLFSASSAIATQQGGLLGYRASDSHYFYFDPASRVYRQITHYNPPPAAENLNETFEIVSFYKPPFSAGYRNVFDISLPVSLIKIAFLLLGIVPLYFILYALSAEFAQQDVVKIVLNHDLLKRNFLSITGFKPMTVAAVLVGGIAIITIVEYLIVDKISSELDAQLGRYAANYQSRVSKAIRPGDTLVGHLIRREDTTAKTYVPIQRTKANLSEKETKYWDAVTYTVEFSDVLEVPIYASLQLVGTAESNQTIAMLDESFDKNNGMKVTNGSNVTFIVNSDYSFSVADSQSQPAGQ